MISEMFESNGYVNHASMLSLSADTVIAKEAKEPNNRVFLGALLFGCIVSFVLCNLCRCLKMQIDFGRRTRSLF